MSLASGTKLGPYEIQFPLGAGGMGEVYRARDTRLDRTVAIKVLPAHLSDNSERKQRFEREAKAISALQHPHICVLHDIGRDPARGTDFLVMEYLEGETLADRIRKGTLPLTEQVKIAIQVAGALAAAHAAGIVHRDLKPGNVMLTQSGAKLLDFGLAKPLSAVASSSSAAAPSFTAVKTMSGPSPAMSPLTTHGSIVGTIQYMSPEQIEGREADARSDIFAFGSILYEMATGKRPFEGKSQIKIASAILEDQPAPVRTLQPHIPAALERVIQTCLSKDAGERFQCAHDLKLQLSWLEQDVDSAESEAEPTTEAGTRFPRSLAGIAMGVATLAAAIAVFLWLRTAAPMSLETYILPPDKSSYTLSSDDASGPVVLSPDGTKIAFVAHDEHNENRIYVRALNDKEAKAVPGTEFATYPFWSPDGNSIGFQSGGKLRRVDLTGGPVLDICGVSRFRGGSWGADAILFTPDVTTGIFRVAPNAGSQPVQVTTIAGDQTTHRWPVLMPDGKHFVYLASNHSDPSASATNGIYFASLDGKENRFVVAAESNAVFERGYLVWEQGGSLLVQSFDPSTGKLRGPTSAIAGGVAYNGSTWRGAFDANANGVLVYQPGLSSYSGQLLLYRRDGKAVALPDTGALMDVRLSPDGRKIAALTRNNHDIWILDMHDGTRVRFTFSATADGLVWSADDKYLYYAKLGTKNLIVRKAVDGSGAETTMLEGSGSMALHVSDISRDGKYMLFEQRSDRVPTTTWVIALSPGGKPRLLTQDPIGTHAARFSPDGRWVVYSTSETGRSELYLTSFDKGGKQQLTTAGGWTSRWSSDGKTLYYSTDEGAVFALPLTINGDAVAPGKPVPLFSTPAQMPTSFYGVSWDATPDGQHFVANVSGERSDQSRAVLITNWPARLQK
jgi:eukaryotic-like serine/threonine-protein kinase